MQTARMQERTPFLGQVDLVPHTGDRRVSGWGQDVSESGMFVQTTQPFAVGDTVSVRFDAYGQEVHVRAAEVMWVRRFEPISVDGKLPGVGLRFVSIDPPARGALRRLSHAGPRGTSTDNAALPSPLVTLPPLSRSIVEAAGGAAVSAPPRDLDDTQDLLPPAALRRTPAAGLPQQSVMPMAAVKFSLPPDEPNLSAESRVFGGVPQAPRPVTMGPRPASTTARPQTTPPSHKTTQPMFTLPPIDVVDRLEPSLTPHANPVAPGPRDARDDPWAGWRFTLSSAPRTVTDEALERDLEALAFAGVGIDELDAARVDVDAVVTAALRARFEDEPPTFVNPTILESVTLAPAPSATAGEDSGGYSLGPLPAPHVGAAATLRALDEGISIRHLPLERPARQTTRERAQQHTKRSGRGGLAAAVLAAGCAAGAGLALWPTLPRAPQPKIAAAAPTASSTAAATVPVAATPSEPVVVAAVASVADAEAELRERERAERSEPKSAPLRQTDSHPNGERELKGRRPPIERGASSPLQEAKAPRDEAKAPRDEAKAPRDEATPRSRSEERPSTTTTASRSANGRVEVTLPEGGRIARAFALGAPARVVVDLEGATLPKAPVAPKGAKQVRFGKQKERERVVIELDGDDKPAAVDARVEGDRLVALWQY